MSFLSLSLLVTSMSSSLKVCNYFVIFLIQIIEQEPYGCNEQGNRRKPYKFNIPSVSLPAGTSQNPHIFRNPSSPIRSILFH